MLSRRYELDKFNKDGSLSKQRDVYYKCDICGGGSKKPEIDHIDPVIEIGKSRKDYTLDEIVKRIDCDIENLQLLCEACHKEKTSNERKVRKK